MKTFKVQTEVTLYNYYTVELPDDTEACDVDDLVSSAVKDGDAQFNYEERYDDSIMSIDEEV